MQEAMVLFLGWEDILEKGMATHSSLPAWRIPRTKEPGGLQSMGSQSVRHDGATFTFFSGFPGDSDGKQSACNAGDLVSIPGLGRSPGEGKSYPLLQYSGLENSMDYSPWGRKELAMTEQLSLSLFYFTIEMVQ